jgi:hypothetical protein
MVDEHAWEIYFQAEIDQAKNARSEGNEGKARVCARRAVGLVLGEYFQRHKIPLDSPSAYDRLRFIEKMPDIPNDLRTKLQHFLLRVNPDYSLPVGADLVEEAQQIRRILLENE